MEENHIYQFSLLNALMYGISESGITASKLATKGNQGLGTFVRMDGELLLLDGKVYRLQAGGRVSEAAPEDQIPFVTSINFVPQKVVKVELANKDDVDEILDQFDKHAANLFMAYRIDGRFKRVKCRTVKGAEKGQLLSDLGKSQFVDTYSDIEGTVVGFRSPKNWSGFAVAGEHLHFIDAKRSAGGHVLEIEGREVMMGMAVVSNVHVELPTSEDFNAANLKTDEQGIKEAEG
jgi:acetolactate decarboxylase